MKYIKLGKPTGAKNDVSQEQLRTCYELALSAIEKMSNASAYLEDFDGEMEGSCITDELQYIIEKCQNKMKSYLKKQFKFLGLKNLKQ